MECEGNRPPMSISEVGGSIVLRARESRVQGEGCQGITFSSRKVIASLMKFGRSAG